MTNTAEHPNPTCMLSSIDWADQWVRLQQLRKRADDASFWDERSKKYGLNDKPSDYAAEFIRLAALDENDTVLDMGCGNGALALPLAEQGHQVIAADFSNGMLGRLKADMEQRGITSITPLHMSWEDNWFDRGLSENCVDVAFASRSISCSNMKDALLKLNAVARKRACITLSSGHSPRTDERIMRALGLSGIVGQDFWYALNILIQNGMNPELSYIKSIRYDTYDSADETYENLALMLATLGDTLSAEEMEEAHRKLRTLVEEELTENENYVEGGKQGRFRLSKPREVCWAFISWETV